MRACSSFRRANPLAVVWTRLRGRGPGLTEATCLQAQRDRAWKSTEVQEWLLQKKRVSRACRATSMSSASVWMEILDPS
jgi:hypothetical protein